MRIYKPSYSKPLPEGAKIFTRKKKRFAKYKDRRGHTIESRLTKNGDKLLCETEHWHVEFEDHQQIRRRIKAFTNEQATKRLADRIRQLMDYTASSEPFNTDLQKFVERMPSGIRDELISFGLLTAKRTVTGKPLTVLVEEFELSLKAKERDPVHIRDNLTMIRRILEDCDFRYWNDITPARVESYLKNMRDNGISYRRSNGYLTAIKSFCIWMVRTSYVSSSPLKHLQNLNAELDRRRERRAATPDEFRRLLESTRQGPERFGLTGYERSLVYWLAAETGLRANEIRTLKVSSFDFVNKTVTIDSSYSKHRERDVLPLQDKLAAELQDYFAKKLPAAGAFHITNKTGDMIQRDLADAGVDYIKDGKYLDFHALRHSFITNLKYAPSSVRMSLARHKSQAMTDRYTHIELQDERAALEALPDLTIASESQRAIKTGTDDNFLPISCLQDAQIKQNGTNLDGRKADNGQKTPIQVNQEGAARGIKTAPRLNSTSRVVPHLSRHQQHRQHSLPSHTHSLYDLTGGDT